MKLLGIQCCQGNVRAVVDADNRVEQAHDYTVSGVPATRLGQTVDHHLHTGKPWHLHPRRQESPRQVS